jgi:hypothetical protein
MPTMTNLSDNKRLQRTVRCAGPPLNRDVRHLQ